METKRRLLLVGGTLMMGDALGYVLGPAKYIQAWRGKDRVRPWARLLDWFGRHQALCACLALGEALAGASLLRRAEAR